ncbi:DUF2849 domain-containing protein [Maritalea sp.]|uniref:DUF2849 domain-containing protein n=1 Tax=Maritalea sp. TaxID=2003361 RepID=UPI0039E24BD7
MNAITANELISGAVVYLYENGDFGVDLQQAKLFGADEAGALETALGKAAAISRLVSLEEIDVEVSETGVVWANRLREQIKANGPTVGGFARQSLEGADHVSL